MDSTPGRKYAPPGMGAEILSQEWVLESMLPQEWEVRIIPPRMDPTKYTPQKWGEGIRLPRNRG